MRLVLVDETRRRRYGPGTEQKPRTGLEFQDVTESPIMKTIDSLCSAIGKTPVFPLRRLSEAAGAEILAKADLLNPGGSLKDRVALAMIEAAEAAGKLSPGATVVEATAGNTGLGLAWVAPVRGYRFVAVMTELDRGPKTEMMEAMGAEVVLVEYGIPWDAENGCLGIADRIARERDGVFLNQFSNPANAGIHETTTAAEILADCGDELDAVIVGVGTGGTATGLGRGLKPALPNLRLIGVVAEGAYLASEREGDRIAGITPDFPPDIFDPSLLDEIVGISSEDAAVATVRLNETEGIPGGHSAGACLLAAENEARARPGSRILILIGDSIRNYPGLGR